MQAHQHLGSEQPRTTQQRQQPPAAAPVLAAGQAAQPAVCVPRAQHHKLPAQLDGAVHGVLDEVNALLLGVQAARKEGAA